MASCKNNWGWMPLTDVDEEETLTLFPEVFSQNKATTDPNITPFPNIKHPNEFDLGKPFSPSMKAGEFLFLMQPLFIVLQSLKVEILEVQ